MDDQIEMHMHMPGLCNVAAFAMLTKTKEIYTTTTTEYVAARLTEAGSENPSVTALRERLELKRR